MISIFRTIQNAENSFVKSEKLCYTFLYLKNGMEGEQMTLNESTENYLETILILNHRLGNVRSVDIANEMNFKKPSVSVAMKNLRENGYITVSPEGHIHLTEIGLEVAERIYERHTTLSNWLTTLGVDPRVAAEDACKMEHDISIESFEAIKRHIKHMNGYS